MDLPRGDTREHERDVGRGPDGAREAANLRVDDQTHNTRDGEVDEDESAGQRKLAHVERGTPPTTAI